MKHRTPPSNNHHTSATSNKISKLIMNAENRFGEKKKRKKNRAESIIETILMSIKEKHSRKTQITFIINFVLKKKSEEAQKRLGDVAQKSMCNKTK